MNEEDEEIDVDLQAKKDPICPRCGLRSYDASCGNCGTPIVDKSDDEDEEYDWREKKR